MATPSNNTTTPPEKDDLSSVMFTGKDVIIPIPGKQPVVLASKSHFEYLVKQVEGLLYSSSKPCHVESGKASTSDAFIKSMDTLMKDFKQTEELSAFLLKLELQVISLVATGVNDITHRHDVIECVAFNNDGTVWSATDYVFILCHNAAGIGIKGPIKWVAARVTLSRGLNDLILAIVATGSGVAFSIVADEVICLINEGRLKRGEQAISPAKAAIIKTSPVFLSIVLKYIYGRIYSSPSSVFPIVSFSTDKGELPDIKKVVMSQYFLVKIMDEKLLAVDPSSGKLLILWF